MWKACETIKFVLPLKFKKSLKMILNCGMHLSKFFFVQSFVIILISSYRLKSFILKSSYLTNSVNLFKFRTERTHASDFVVTKIGETNSTSSLTVSFTISFSSISSNVLSTRSSSWALNLACVLHVAMEFYLQIP